MPRISNDIKEIQGKLKEAEIPMGENVRPTKAMMYQFLRIYENIDDMRSQGMISYTLPEIILAAFLAVLGGADDWGEIAAFCQYNQRWLSKFMRSFKHKTPSHDTFRRVFGMVDTEQLQAFTVAILVENISRIRKTLKLPEEYRHLAVDGKEENGTGRTWLQKEGDKVRNLQTLHIHDVTNGVCIYSKGIDQKTNEIPVAQEALASMDLRKVIVSGDALHTQAKTVEIIINRKGDYVLGLKGNQSGLLEDVSACFSEEEKGKIRRKGKNYFQTKEKNHSQIETRSYYLMKAYPDEDREKKWKKLRSFICFEKEIQKADGTITKEMRYYITSLTDVELCADVIRGHWGVEAFHWMLDYTFHEDDNTTMDRKAFDGLGQLKKMSLSLCTLVKPLVNNASMKVIRKMFGWNYEDMLGKLLYCLTPETIEEAMKKTKKARANKNAVEEYKSRS